MANRCGVKDEISYNLTNREALLEYLETMSRKQEAVALLFELEDLDKWFAIYSPDIICQSIQGLLSIINDVIPKNARLFPISNGTYSIIFSNVNIDKVVEFAHILRSLIAERKNRISLDEPDFRLCIGIAKGYSKYVVPKSFSALKYAKKILSKIYLLDIDDDEFQKHQQNNIELSKIVKDAAYKGNIVPFYQPIYDNRLQKITKYECLSRLIYNDKILQPFDFLYIARQMGFMRSITYSVINNSFKIFKDNDFEFSINITEEDIRDSNVLDYLSNRCKKYHIDPSRIIIELLEDIEFGDDNLVVNNINILKNMGFKIAIDDFGYANSNFGRLIKMQIDYVKIDGRFVKNIDTDPISYKIVKSISMFAKSVDVQCIAEYVHSEAIHSLVLSFGIEFSQGYYIGKAVSSLNN